MEKYITRSESSLCLGIIIIDYKNASRTIKYIKEEISKITIPHKLVIVNNEASEESNLKFTTELGAVLVDTDKDYSNSKANIFLIPSYENLGFAKGNNLGASFLIKNFNCQYLLFSNNDIIIKDGNVATDLIAKLEIDSSIGMIGPEVIGLDGQRQSPEPYISMSDRYVWMYLLTPFITKKYKRKKFKLNYSSEAQEGYHYRIMGSFFIMPSDIFIKIDKMDPNTFLYAEEMILSEKLKKIDKLVYFYPDSTVIHAHGATTKEHLGSKKISKIQSKSEIYYYTHYCGLKHWKASLYYFLYKILLRLK